jgi:hypothetical protein
MPRPMPIPTWRVNSSPIQPYVLPEYAEVLAQAFGSGVVRYVPSRATSCDPRALVFMDTEAVVGDSESSRSDSGSSDYSIA